MNSLIASGINGSLAFEKKSTLKIANGALQEIMQSRIEYPVVEKKSSFSSTDSFHCLTNSNEPKKLQNGISHNKSSINHTKLGIDQTKNNSLKGNSEDGIPDPKIQLYNGQVQLRWKQVNQIGAGLVNLGNTCFLNTVIQCLTYCPPLANYLLYENDHHPERCNIGKTFCMICILQKHIKRAIGKPGVLKPLDIYQRLKLIAKNFQYGRQEDAHEFLRYVVDNLWKSSLSLNNNNSKLDPASKETTVFNQIFGGYHRSQVTCLKCKESSNTYDHFMDIILDINKPSVVSLATALEKYTQPELLQHENSYKCPKCKTKVTAQKRFSVYRPPNVATFQLKRFDYNRSLGGKITKSITYPEKLNLRPYMSESKGEPVWYHLNAVLVHTGFSCTSGHYYCFVKNSNNAWYAMDDSKVSRADLSVVLSQMAYVLFYVKASNAQNPTVKKMANLKSPVTKENAGVDTFKKSAISAKSPQVLGERPLNPFAKQNNENFNSRLSLPLDQNRERISFGMRSSLSNAAQPLKPMQSSSTSTSSSVTGLVPYVKDSESSDESPQHSSRMGANPHVNGNSQKKRKNSDIRSYFNESSPKASEALSKTVPQALNNSISSPKNSASESNSQSDNQCSHNGTNGIDTVSVDQKVQSEDSASLSTKSNSFNSPYKASKSDHLISPSGSLNSVKNSSSKSEKHTLASKDSNHSSPYKSDSQSSPYKTTFNKDSHDKSYKTTSKRDHHDSSCKTTPKEDSQESTCKTTSKNNRSDSPYKTVSKKDNQGSPYQTSQLNHDSSLNASSKKIIATGQWTITSDDENSASSSQNKSSRDWHITEMDHSDFRPQPQQPSTLKRKHSGPSDSEADPEAKSDNRNGGTLQKGPQENGKKRVRSESPEYEWVEKTKEDIETGNKQTKWSNENVSNTLRNNSQYLYKTPVPTWKGSFKCYNNNRNNNNRQFNGYEDERDLGKMRKFKFNPKKQNYRDNPFQRYSDRGYNNKFNDRPHWNHNNNYNQNRRFQHNYKNHRR